MFVGHLRRQGFIEVKKVARRRPSATMKRASPTIPPAAFISLSLSSFFYISHLFVVLPLRLLSSLSFFKTVGRVCLVGILFDASRKISREKYLISFVFFGRLRGCKNRVYKVFQLANIFTRIFYIHTLVSSRRAFMSDIYTLAWPVQTNPLTQPKLKLTIAAGVSPYSSFQPQSRL